MNIGAGGNLSGGKTVTLIMLMVQDHVQKKKKIISTIKLADLKYTYMESEALIDFIIEHKRDQDALTKMFSNSIVFWDEIRNALSARKSTSNLNEQITQFMMMVGKLDCDVYYTYQILESQVDKQLRYVTDFFLDPCMRLDINGNTLFGKPRIYKDEHGDLVPIRIQAQICVYRDEKLIPLQGRMITFDPQPYYHFYNTREIVIVDREKYLKK